MSDNQMQITEERSFYVAKANELIRKAKLDLTLRELKLLSYLISKVKPTDRYDTTYTMTIPEYCRVRGIDDESGTHYEAVKQSLKSLRDKSVWIMDENGDEVLNGWIARPRISRKSGKITFEFDRDIQKYIIDLKGNYTQYELLSVLPMGSVYSIRLYEWMRSYVYNSSNERIDLKQLKRLLNVDTKKSYDSFKEFKRRVLDPSIKEINLYTDLQCSYEKHYDGRSVTAITFFFELKDLDAKILTYKNVDDALDNDMIPGQMNIYDYLSDNGSGI